MLRLDLRKNLKVEADIVVSSDVKAEVGDGVDTNVEVGSEASIMCCVVVSSVVELAIGAGPEEEE